MKMEVRNRVRGIAHDTNVAKVTVVGVPDRPGIANTIFEPLAQAKVSVDTIVQNVSFNQITDLTFTVEKNDFEKAMRLITPVAKSIGARDVVGDLKLAKVSIIGSGMQSASGYAFQMFNSLYKEGINIELITTSEIRITCLIEESRIQDAVRALHKTFIADKSG